MLDTPEAQKGSAFEVFSVFLRLGCISFGGPAAHLGYFQKELILDRRWCDENRFAELIALAQSLPGPSSSQVCLGMGVIRAGWLGGLAAWTAFTLPSALLTFAFAFGAALLSGRIGLRLVHGLQLVAVAVVAQAVLTMQRSLAPDRQRIALAMVVLAIVLIGPPRFASLLGIVGGCVAGLSPVSFSAENAERGASFAHVKEVGTRPLSFLLRPACVTSDPGPHQRQLGTEGTFRFLSNGCTCIRWWSCCVTPSGECSRCSRLGQ